jgi:uncharacterized protein
MEASVTRPVARLSELNDIDLVVDSIKARLAEIAEGLKEPAALRSARTALAGVEAEVAALRVRQQDCELRQKTADEKLAHDEKRLYGGQVHIPKELQDLQAEVGQSRRQRSQAEDELLETMVAAEAAEEKRAAAQKTLDALVAEWATRQVELRTGQAKLKKRLETELARQAAARARAPSQLLLMYDTLRVRKNGRAVATLLDNEVCSECKVAVSPTKAFALRDGDELVYCENCGRLLFGE